jgi:MoxR-like ATPase
MNSSPELPRTFFDPDDAAPRHRTYYFHDTELIDAINIAIALGRPLLLTGSAGMGKSTVAEAVALQWGSEPLRRVITSRSEAEDLKYVFDSIGRLSDASAHQYQAKDKIDYITPGLLWCAYDPANARSFLIAQDAARADARIAALKIPEPDSRRVVLIDELDKADLDFANDLLDIFDEGRFEVPYAERTISLKDRDKLLVVITSNGERQFSEAFLRRCIRFEIKGPNKDDAGKLADAILKRRAMLSKESRHKWLTAKSIDRLATLSLQGKTLQTARFADLLNAVIAFGGDNAEQVLGALEAAHEKRR